METCPASTLLESFSLSNPRRRNPYSLIIGIDNYAHAINLTGAVADAKHFKKFLLDEVKVKPERIQALHNEEATREGIAKAFRLLWENDSISTGDSIIIYFAGHGCKIQRPNGWETGGQENIEGILPQDVQPQQSPTRTIFPIPDLTMAAWLNIISHEKGNNIVCCHCVHMHMSKWGIVVDRHLRLLPFCLWCTWSGSSCRYVPGQPSRRNRRRHLRYPKEQGPFSVQVSTCSLACIPSCLWLRRVCIRRGKKGYIHSETVGIFGGR